MKYISFLDWYDLVRKTGEKKTLLIIPSVSIWKIGGKIFFDRKFYDGIIFYCNNWNGDLHLVMRSTDTSPPEFGLVLFDYESFPARLTVVEQDEVLSEIHVKGTDVVLVSGDDFRSLHISAITKRLGIRCVYSIENIFETRFQIINMSKVSFWQKLKSFMWAMLTERKRDKAFRLADGIQANGVPAYKNYSKLVDNTMLYFDSRNTAKTNITEYELSTRLSALDYNIPIRLGFSGRLIAMKGVEDLVEMAQILKKNQVAFTLDIFGAGNLEPVLNQKIKEYQLEKYVRLRGNVDFSMELIPFIKKNLDLFVCCHRQSDPSCTYLETYACGVPIVGYANQAHQGILEKYDVGWSVAMGNIYALADKVSYLNEHRGDIKKKANNAKIFSSAHTFEKTFGRCMEQCATLAERF